MAGTNSRRGGKSGPIMGINITPMVDVMLVLLVIMMVSAVYIVSQTLKVTLPKTANSDAPAESPLAVTITKDGKYLYEQKPIDETGLVGKLHAAKQQKKEATLVVTADKESFHGDVVHVIDLAKSEGITKFAINVERRELNFRSRAPQMSRRSKKSSKVYAISIGVHLVIGLAIAFIPKDKLKEIIAISMGESNKPKPQQPKREDKPHDSRPRAAASHGTSKGTSTVNAVAAAAAPVFTDIGISMDASGSEGVAVATAPKAPPPPKMLAMEPAKPKVLAAKQSDCDEPIVKAHPDKIVRPEFTTEARTAGVDGRVMIELMIDDRGNVASAKLLKGLGHGLDESSLDAAKRTHFVPATRCGKPVAAPLVIKMRFSLAS